MKIKILFFLILIATASQAQTKVIAHKSHSGSNKSFSKAYKNSLFDISSSNFGLPEHKIIVLDTVIALDDSHVILKIRESIGSFPVRMDYRDIDKSAFRTKTKIIKDSLFNAKNSISYIKLAPPYRYPLYFVNPIESVVFIGFKKPF